MPQTLSQIKALLAMHGLQPRKRHGQNFLHDARYMERILDAAQVRPGDLVLEVGPGTGSLSEGLLEAGARLLAVEIDAALAPILRERFRPWGDQAELIIADVLAGKHAIAPDVVAALNHRLTPGSSAALIANLPYNVASPLMVTVLESLPRVDRMVVMIQREVADRLLASPDSKAWGPLGVIIQTWALVERVALLPPGCFWPPPQVESAVVRLQRRPAPLASRPAAFTAFVHRLFQGRRKQLGRLLGRDQPWPEHVQPTDRPDALPLDRLIALFDAVEPDAIVEDRPMQG